MSETYKLLSPDKKPISKLKKVCNIIYTIITIIVVFIAVNGLIGRFLGEKSLSVFGLSFYVIQSDSMSKVDESNLDWLKDTKAGFINKNDIVITYKQKSQDKITIGTIVTYVDSNGYVILHRVYDIIGEDRVYVLRGDANNVNDPDIITFKEITGVYLCKIPQIGIFINFAKSFYGVMAFIFVIFIWLLSKYLKIIEAEKHN